MTPWSVHVLAWWANVMALKAKRNGQTGNNTSLPTPVRVEVFTLQRGLNGDRKEETWPGSLTRTVTGAATTPPGSTRLPSSGLQKHRPRKQAVPQSCPTYIWSWRSHRSWWPLSNRSIELEHLQEQAALSSARGNNILPSNAEAGNIAWLPKS